MPHDSAPKITNDHPSTELRSFGRRRGRTFGARQAKLYDTVLPTVQVDLSAAPATCLNPAQPHWLEIGFGGAEHLLWQARTNPDVRIIGCEPFRDGVAKALAGIEAFDLRNLGLHPDDARPLIRWLPDASLDRVFILFPDPWPKRKHIKRRLVATPTLDLLARTMKPGAELRVATDIGDYARTILISVLGHAAFEWPARGPDDWRVRGPDWPPTRYEQKAVQDGRRCNYFRFRRRADAEPSRPTVDAMPSAEPSAETLAQLPAATRAAGLPDPAFSATTSV
jgi:tRNA (guanine-N7-)-methyltransferase